MLPVFGTEQFVSGRVWRTEARAAEVAKLVENIFRGVNIALANELSLICDQVGVDVWEVIDLANHHPRGNLLRPGPGVGGHYLAARTLGSSWIPPRIIHA